MDADALKAMGAKVTFIRRAYSRKLGDKQFGSIGAEMEIEVSVPSEGDADAISRAAWELCRDTVKDELQPALEAIQKVRDVPQPVEEHEPPQPPLPTAPSGPVEPPSKPEPEHVQTDDTGAEYKTFDIDHFTVHETDGKRSAKVFGGPYKKFGVRAWPEKMAEAGVDIAVCNTGVEYKMPKGITKAVAILNEKSNPQKIVRWE